MIGSIPVFDLATHYEERNDSYTYRFTAISDTSIYTNFDTGICASFKDAKGKEWLRIEGHKITVRKGYSWNGCSPKRKIFGRWVGTPDTPDNVLASLFHDALVQFYMTQHMLLNKEQIDLLFYHILVASGFKYPCQWHWAVKNFGRYAASKNGEHSEQINNINYEEGTASYCLDCAS